MQARDTIINKTTSKAIPTSEVGLEWQSTLMEQQIQLGKAPFQTTVGMMQQRDELAKLQRDKPYFKRNESHICSFYVRGTCNRGAECPYRHEMPNYDPNLANQNFKDRYYGNNDPVAKKLLSKVGVNPLSPPADTNIKTLFIGGVTSVVTEEDLR